MAKMKLKITPEMRARLMHAETMTIDIGNERKLVSVALSRKQIVAVAGEGYSREDEELIRSEWETLLDNAE